MREKAGVGIQCFSFELIEALEEPARVLTYYIIPIIKVEEMYVFLVMKSLRYCYEYPKIVNSG
jgi:hypothetical protein